tara:strand:- start:1724 stop:2626 length:903 start_codon:yes stop_codon:yes gene_type:complete
LINWKELKLSKEISLANFTTLRIGGTAEFLAEPKSIEEIKTLIRWSNEKKIPCNIIGAGSNLLISDLNIGGLTLCTRKLNGSELNSSTGEVKAVSGESLPSLARKAANAGLHGLEWAIGIPGTIGGAVTMNAGAQGGCIAERLIKVEVINIKGGKTFYLTNKELDFSYRNSLIQKENLILLSAYFQLEPGQNSKFINEMTNKNLEKRKQTQPYHLPTCGSVFRNPEPLKAGIIIEKLGLKGFRQGGAEISTMHANFIINSGNATASDVSQLIEIVQTKVKAAHGFLLHPEVKQLGFERNL